VLKGEHKLEKQFYPHPMFNKIERITEQTTRSNQSFTQNEEIE
jgi:hypothetical protein